MNQSVKRYEAHWGSFKFCVGNSEIDWTKGSEQHKFLERCFATVDRSKQPWLIFVAHRALGYSSAADYQEVWGTFGEPNGRANLEDLWQKYKVDLAFYGHVHNYERTCPVYQVHNHHPQFNPPIILFQTAKSRNPGTLKVAMLVTLE